jgi:hypothetical protein
MTGRKPRWLGIGMVAGAGAGLLALTSAMASAFAYGETPDVVGDPPLPFEVMGGSGMPIPPDSYVDAVQSLYFPATANFLGQPTFPTAVPEPLFTPEGDYPFTGVNSLPLDTSVSQGVQILNDTIQPYIAAGTPVGVFGYSQSAIIASLEMENLAATDPTAPVQFVLIGDQMNPNGGLFERFAGLQLPSLGMDFYGATPSNDFPTTIYTLEYDSQADFPRYPLDFLSDLNAMGTSVHGTYPDLTTAQLESAIPLMTTGTTDTTYYIIPVENLPLLDPLREIPVVGNPLADLFQPDLTYLVNLGYGDPLYGYSTSAANVATPFGLFPPLSAFEQLPGLLASGTVQGMENFIGDFTGTGPNPVSLSLDSLLPSLLDPSSATSSILSNPLAALSALAADPAALAAAPTDIVNALSSVASTAYGTLLPLADILNAALTSVPAYDVSLFLDNLSDPINAIGLPIAADTALYTLLGGYALTVGTDAVQSIVADLPALIPF